VLVIKDTGFRSTNDYFINCTYLGLFVVRNHKARLLI